MTNKYKDKKRMTYFVTKIHGLLVVGWQTDNCLLVVSLARRLQQLRQKIMTDQDASECMLKFGEQLYDAKHLYNYKKPQGGANPGPVSVESQFDAR